MSEEQLQPIKKSDGERWLELIGFAELGDQPTGHEIDGEPVLTKDFDRLCGDHARPIFAGLEALDPSDSRYETFRNLARSVFEAHFAPQETES